MKTILIIGSGAREVAICKKLLESADVNIHNISTFTNPDMKIMANEIFIVKNYLIENIKYDFNCDYEYVIIGPEKPLEEGYVEFFDKIGIPCIGPKKDIALLETSKSFCRNFLSENNLSSISPKYVVLQDSNYDDVCNLLDHFNRMKLDIVVKQDGLCGGKGVVVQGVDFESSYNIIENLVNNKNKIVIEEKLCGNEFSLFSICDGNGGIKHFPPIMDYKRLNNNNLGPNTGGMGCVIDKNNSLPFLNNQNVAFVQHINKKIYSKCPDYKGILYGSYIKCLNGEIKLIEINCRFGDPECIIALELLKTNFKTLMDYTIQGRLSELPPLEFSKDAMMCVYMVPKEYPNASDPNYYDVFFTDKDVMESNNLIFSNVIFKDNHLYSNTSRTLLIASNGSSISECRKHIYNIINSIVGNLYYRTDIGLGINFIKEDSNDIDKYEECGVSVNKANNALKLMKNDIKSTYNFNVVSDFGAFSGEYLFNNNILLTSIDGVGTKSILVRQFLGEKGYISLGHDIVNHCINDILVQGGKPLFFLDYFGTSNININELVNFVKGVSEACKNYDVVLMGGETAEMPNFYRNNNTELIGCIVGTKHIMIDTKNICKNDVLLYIDSSGPHTNGYSLIRTLNLNENEIAKYPNLLASHRCYYNDIQNIVDRYGQYIIKGMCHITGGGLYENLKRVIPTDLHNNIQIDIDSIDYPEWILFLQKKLNMSMKELLNIFNCGIGYIIIVSESEYSKVVNKNIKYLGKII